MKTLTIDHLSHDLRGVARVDGVAWLVDGALPGEQVSVRERERYSHRVEADLAEIIHASTERITPACECAQQCGGCDLQHMDYATQLLSKQQVLKEQLSRIAGFAQAQWLEPLFAESWSYRRRARIACQWSSDRKYLAVGFRQRHSKAIVEINHCAVLVPALQKLLPALRECLSQWSQPRQLGHIELLAADNGIGILLRTVSAVKEKDQMLLQRLAAEYAVTVYVQQDDKNSIQYFCGKNQNLVVRNGLLGANISCVPGDFLQANAAVNTLLVDEVIKTLQPTLSDKVLEAFCGLGNFTLPLAKKVERIAALEVSEAMVERAQLQSTSQGLNNIDWVRCNLDNQKSCEKSYLQVNKILLDPPRDGAQTFCRYVNLEGVERIVYVSCNPATLVRDADILASRGFSLASVRMLDMFPQTSHIETLAVFSPVSKKNKQPQSNQKKALKKLKR